MVTMRSHPLRAALSEEMHVRRLPRIAAPCRLLQVVTLIGEASITAAHDHIEALAALGSEVVPLSAKYAAIRLDGIDLVWERHTEFATYTLIYPGAFDSPFDPALFDLILAKVADAMPGEVIRATQIALVEADRPDPTPEQLGQWFASGAMIVCDVAGGTARILSDFRLNEDGYGRLLILDRKLAHDEPAQLVLRLQELGNYRNMALLGLPLAQQLTPTVSGLEARLAGLTHAVSSRPSENDQLLDELTFLSAELARIMAETRYRMSATQAYATLSTDRLASLCIDPVRGYQTLADFTERRLLPAVRTCASFSSRLEDLSQRAAWTSALLRTRIDIALAKQNRDLLTSMDRRTQLQLRLQQTVEGLSVVAISYYLTALVGYLLYAVPGVSHAFVMAMSVPLVILAVTLTLRRVRRRFSE